MWQIKIEFLTNASSATSYIFYRKCFSKRAYHMSISCFWNNSRNTIIQSFILGRDMCPRNNVSMYIMKWHNKIWKWKIIISSWRWVSSCAAAIVSHLLRIKSDYSHRFRFRHQFGCNQTWDPTCYWITIRPGAQSPPASCPASRPWEMPLVMEIGANTEHRKNP